MRLDRTIRWFSCLASAILFSNLAFAEVEFLEQNWDEEIRQFYYTTSQGSRLIPYDWFLALEVSDSETSFAREHVLELGYLPNDNTSNNPDRLAVGFVADTDSSGRKHVGLNCAACHTNQIAYDGKTYQIDGAPTLGDMWALLAGIGDSLNATHDGHAKFERFASKILGQNHSRRGSADLKAELAQFLHYWNQFIADSTVDHPWGRARLDAFGMIFNRVTVIDLKIPANNKKPDAPVSYPFLWGTSWEDKVQWIGSAPNTNDIERLGRNIGEVLGVFGEAELRRASLFRPYYRSSARRLNQLLLENALKDLWSPAWPSDFPEIDSVKAAAGKALFQQHCVSCHEVIPHGEQDTPVTVVMTPLSRAGTDPRTAMNAVTGTALTGALQGSRIPGFDSLPAEMPRGVLLSNVVRGALFSPFRDVPASDDLLGIGLLRARLRGLNDQHISDEEIRNFIKELDVTEEEILDMAQKYEKKLKTYAQDIRKAARVVSGLESVAANDDGPRVLAYKARPLDGIWATAPYLHNGSVPNLYELLLPVDQRSKTFHVGSKEFDPVRVGFETDEAPGTTLFDTSKPGNWNTGHDTYGDFNKTERWQLVEYMKTL